MKKYFLYLCCLWLSACSTVPITVIDPNSTDDERAVQEQAANDQFAEKEIINKQTINVPSTEKETVNEELSDEKIETGIPYDSDEMRIARNVRVKQSDEYGITYEYKNVRIDEIAYLASEYCYKHKGRKAVLHDSQLFKNFSRRATFHCIELQN